MSGQDKIVLIFVQNDQTLEATCIVVAQMLIRSVQVNTKKCLETSDVQLLFHTLLSDVTPY